ncbi:MAG: DegV family protein [Clostridia bacterium]|nr:DegV family protein [Clostridia bacterium]
MRIITDSAADFTREEFVQYKIDCVPMQVMFGTESFSAAELEPDAFWQRLLSGEIAKTSQPSPDAFFSAFEAAHKADEEILYVGVSSAISGTLQSAHIAASMLEEAKVHIVDALTGAGGQKLLTLHACRLRDEGKKTVAEIAADLERLRSRIRLYASLDTLENLARSGRISKAAASIGTLAQLKPLARLTPETNGNIEVCGKAIGRHRAIDAVAKLILKHRIDESFPVIPIYTYCQDNCTALVKKLKSAGVAVSEHMYSALGPTLSTHIGPNAYGIVFVEAE